MIEIHKLITPPVEPDIELHKHGINNKTNLPCNKYFSKSKQAWATS